MKFITIPKILALAIICSSCSTYTLKQASISYKNNRDYESAKIICDLLRVGMKKSDVENLLGEPDYSPVEGDYYYSIAYDEEKYFEMSDEDRQEVINGIVVSYRFKDEHTGNMIVTDEFKGSWIGHIGE